MESNSSSIISSGYLNSTNIEASKLLTKTLTTDKPKIINKEIKDLDIDDSSIISELLK